MTITIYHNPACGTSSSVLEILKASEEPFAIIEYLKNPPSKNELTELVKKMGVSARDILRNKGDLYEELKLSDDKWSDEELIDIMAKHPILINRPIVVSEKGAKLCRPADLVRELL